eukprot:scaffold5254_cov118-Skeletonema_dohrnii-CCMP3373.AAC.4
MIDALSPDRFHMCVASVAANASYIVTASDVCSVYPQIRISRAIIGASPWSLPQTSTNLRERRAEGDELQVT